MPKILYLVTEDWYFCLHRLPIARSIHKAGWKVVVATRVKTHGELIRREGFELIPMSWDRKSLNPLRAVAEVREVVKIYGEQKPDLVHHIAIKPSIYGTIAALFKGITPVINNLAGLGHAFSSNSIPAKIIRSVLVLAFRTLFNLPGTQTIVENCDDRDFLVKKLGVKANSVVLIRGIGVDLSQFTPIAEPDGIPVVTMVSRMLWPKGVGDLVEAARILRDRKVQVKVVLVGMPDMDNSASVPESQLRTWESEGLVKWLGHQNNISKIWSQSNIAVLPSSYREGVPRSLLEAAASGRAIVTTDTPGCREVVRHEENGLLVPKNDPHALALAITRLAKDAAMRRRMAIAGRKRVEELFSEETVVRKTLQLYTSSRAS